MQYEIKGGSMPVVVCTLQNGESIKTEKGAMSWMSPNMEMQTNAGGGIGKAFSRIFTGESMFQNIYTARGGTGLIAFAPAFREKFWQFRFLHLVPLLPRNTHS